MFEEGVERLKTTTVRSLKEERLCKDTDDGVEAVDMDCELSVLEDLLDSETELRELELTRLREMELSDRELLVLAVADVLEDSETLERLSDDCEDTERLETLLAVDDEELVFELD